ncbi:MAG TPA: chromate transporter [Tepidimicrobium sp.]|nr:chromate transporter [Tepidimicrobium sp.]
MRLLFEMFMTFFKVGAFTIGGGYAMIPLIQVEIVEKKEWLTEEEFMDILVIAEATPGPVVINTSTYVGYKLMGLKGALLTTLGAVLPSFVIMLIIVNFLWQYRYNPLVEKVFLGIRPAVAALISSAVYKIFKQMRPNRIGILQAIITVIIILVFHISPAYIIIAAAMGAILYFKRREQDI